MSHEIRNPLSGVILNAEFLESTKLDIQQRSYVDGIGRSGKMLLTIVNDVLDVTKIESGKLTLERIPFLLSQEIEFIVQTAAPQAYAKGVEIACHIEKSLYKHFLGDPTRIRQIIHNFANNAVKFTADGSVVIRAFQVTMEDAIGKKVSFCDEIRKAAAACKASQSRTLFHCHFIA